MRVCTYATNVRMSVFFGQKSGREREGSKKADNWRMVRLKAVYGNVFNRKCQADFINALITLYADRKWDYM